MSQQRTDRKTVWSKYK